MTKISNRGNVGSLDSPPNASKAERVQHIEAFLREARWLVQTFQRPSMLRGTVGELLTLRTLLAQGENAHYRAGTKKGTDIVLVSGGRDNMINCKEKTGPKWVRMNLDKFWVVPKNLRKGQSQRKPTHMKPDQSDFYVLIDAEKFLKDEGDADFYTFTLREWCDFVKERYFRRGPERTRAKNPNSWDFTLTVEKVSRYRDPELRRLRSRASTA